MPAWALRGRNQCTGVTHREETRAPNRWPGALHQTVLSLSLPPAPHPAEQSKLTDLEVLALLVAALSHDLDHRGVNNSYIQR